MARVGERIGPFELVERVESDGITELWRARRVDNKLRELREVALRLCAAPADPEAAEAVRQEYEALRGLEDPRFPQVVGYYAGSGALALGWVQGHTLAELLAAARAGRVLLDWPTALELGLELAQALRTAHAAADGVRLHGWLRPDQVLLRADGELVLLGLGRQPPEWDPRYLPPESLDAWPEDPRVDQWLHGALLYELLTHRPLYDSPGGGPLVRKDPEAQLAALERELPEAARLLRRTLATAPSRRFPSDADWLLALHALVRAVGGSSSRAALPEALQAAAAEQADVAESAALAATASLIEEPRLASGPSLALVRAPAELREDPSLALGRAPSTLPPTLSLGLSTPLPAAEQVPEEPPPIEPAPASVEPASVGPAPVGPAPVEPAPVEPAVDDDAPLAPSVETWERVAWVAIGVLALTGMIVAARILL